MLADVIENASYKRNSPVAFSLHVFDNACKQLRNMAFTITIKALFTGVVILAASVWVYYSFEVKRLKDMHPTSLRSISNLNNILQIFPRRRDIEISAYHPRIHTVQDSSKVKRAAHFPLIIHTMWKSPDSSPPAETVRWRKVRHVHSLR